MSTISDDRLREYYAITTKLGITKKKARQQLHECCVATRKLGLTDAKAIDNLIEALESVSPTSDMPQSGIKRHLDELIETAENLLGIEESSLNTRINPSISKADLTINTHASANRTRDKYNITINYPLSLLVGGLAALIASGMNENQDGLLTHVVSTFRREQPWERKARTLLEACLSDDFHKMHVPIHTMDLDEFTSFGLHTESAELFIVAHELGHIMMWELERLDGFSSTSSTE